MNITIIEDKNIIDSPTVSLRNIDSIEFRILMYKDGESVNAGYPIEEDCSEKDDSLVYYIACTVRKGNTICGFRKRFYLSKDAKNFAEYITTCCERNLNLLIKDAEVDEEIAEASDCHPNIYEPKCVLDIEDAKPFFDEEPDTVNNNVIFRKKILDKLNGIEDALYDISVRR